MKSLILALLLGGSTWHVETYAGFVCPTKDSAGRVASIEVKYALASILDSSDCIFAIFDGKVIDESVGFNIGDHVYTFLGIETEGTTVYLLNDKGEGYMT